VLAEAGIPHWRKIKPPSRIPMTNLYFRFFKRSPVGGGVGWGGVEFIEEDMTGGKKGF